MIKYKIFGGWFIPVMADSSWPHKYDAIKSAIGLLLRDCYALAEDRHLDDDLQQEHNNHGEGSPIADFIWSIHRDRGRPFLLFP